MPFPNITDYTASVENAASQVVDPVLTNSKPRLRNNRAEKMSGGMAVVFPFQAGTNIYAVKCWLRDLGDMRIHYQKVEAFLRTAGLKYFVEFGFVENGIIANGSFWPILRMKWVSGCSLLEFVDKHHSDAGALRLLAERYLTMSQALHQQGVAHGDLQGSNIKVVGSGSGIEIQLIDYDTLVIPDYYGKPSQTIALPSYQHPRRKASPNYTGKEDYFSELVIYLSLLAVAEKPSLWRKYPKGGADMAEQDRHDKDMLFVAEDFTAAKPTEVFKELYGLSPSVRRLAVILWNYTQAPSIEKVLPLEAVVKLVKEAESASSATRAMTGFERMLESANSGGGNWLDDSTFVTHPRLSSNTRPGQTGNSSGRNFDDWLRDIAPPPPARASDTARQAGTAPSNPTPAESFWPIFLVLGVIAFMMFLAIIVGPHDTGPTPSTASWQDASEQYASAAIREKSGPDASKDSAVTLPSNREGTKKAVDAAGYAVSEEFFPKNMPNPAPYVPILNVPSHRPLPSVPLPNSPSEANLPRQPDFSIYDSSLLRFLRSEHPDWIAGLQQVPRPKYLGRLDIEQHLAVKFIQPDAPQIATTLTWYAQMRVRDEHWQALSPSTDYETKGTLIADFCKRHPASLETLEGVVSTYIEGLNSRRLADLLAIYSDEAVWVERGSKSTDRSKFEGNLGRTYETWPRSRVDVCTAPEVADGSADDMASLQFRTRFRMENSASGKWVEGTRSTRWQLKKVNVWRVVREETSLVTPPYEGVLSSEVQRTATLRVQEPARSGRAREVSPSRLRVVNVASDDLLALRILPDSRARKLADIPFNATGIESAGESQLNGGDIWVPIRWNGVHGWAHGNFLDYE